MPVHRAFVMMASLVAGWLAGTGTLAADDANPRVAFFGFRLLNTSLEATTEAEARRVLALDTLFRTRLEASGRFTIVAIPQGLLAEIDAGPAIGHCNGCERDYTRRLDASLASWGTVQKVSNLILNINVYIADARTGELIFMKSVDIRGNTDESWSRGLGYLLRNYLLQER